MQTTVQAHVSSSTTCSMGRVRSLCVGDGLDSTTKSLLRSTLDPPKGSLNAVAPDKAELMLAEGDFGHRREDSRSRCSIVSA